MVLPDAIDDHAGRQRVARIRYPFGELKAPMRGRCSGRRGRYVAAVTGDQRQIAWPDLRRLAERVAVQEQLERRRLRTAVREAERLRAELVLRRPTGELCVSGIEVAAVEVGGEGVVVALRDRVELMVVAASAADGQA